MAAMRLIITSRSKDGKGGERAQAYVARCEEIMKEPGCRQFEAFQSVLDPDKFVLLELWEDADALAVHAEANRTRAPLAPDLRGDAPVEREDYEYNRTR